jgi:hypothetical protein
MDAWAVWNAKSDGAVRTHASGGPTKAPGEGLTGHLGGYLTPDREESMDTGKEEL